MMVNCPKCGFSQPQDQYCAKCGVDMVTFRPVAKPLFTRLILNTTFQVSVLAFVALGGGLYVRQANREKLARTIAETPIARDAEQQETELAAAQADENSKASLRQTVSASITDSNGKSKAELEVAAVPLETAAATSFVASSAPVSPPSGSAAPPPLGTRSAFAPASNLRVYFIEAQRGLISSLLSDARQTSSDGTFSYGVVANLERRLKASHAWQSLDTSGEQALHLNQPNVIFKGTRDQNSGQNLGFTIQVIPLSHDENGTHLQIDANRVLRDQANGLDSFDFPLPESVTLQRNSSFLLTGALPHRALYDSEERLYRSVNVLKSMGNEQFRAGQTDVAIVIETR